MLRIMKYLSKAEIGQMLIALVTIVGQVYFDLKLPDYMSDITTLVETPGSHMKDIWIAGGKMLLISLGSAACAIITGYIAARVAASFTQRLRSLEFRKVESFGPAEMSKFSTASLITRSTNDVTQVQMFITMGLQLIVKSPIMAVWAVCKIAGEGFEWTLATGIAVAVLLVSITVMMAMVMPKFRSMRIGTPAVATHLLADPKSFLTPIGSFLRKSSLDELPQLWSILKGDMSFVGPRPALFNQDDLIALRTEKGVHELLPGLTGWAQVNGRDELPIPQKVQLDVEYLHRRSFLFDLKIIWMTALKVLARDGVSH